MVVICLSISLRRLDEKQRWTAVKRTIRGHSKQFVCPLVTRVISLVLFSCLVSTPRKTRVYNVSSFVCGLSLSFARPTFSLSCLLLFFFTIFFVCVCFSCDSIVETSDKVVSESKVHVPGGGALVPRAPSLPYPCRPHPRSPVSRVLGRL